MITCPPVGSAATDGGDTWAWVLSNPTAFHGSLANQSTIAAGLHQHYFTGATASLRVSPGDVLFAYVYLDPAHLPSEVMLQWYDGSWEHRAYWGANNIAYGVSGSASRAYMGPLPAAGQWALLQVPASQVALEGSTLNGMAFSQYDGRATWDYRRQVLRRPDQYPSLRRWHHTPLPPVGHQSPPPATNPPPVISTNVPGVSPIDYVTPQLPNVGDNTLHVLTPTLLELKLINTKQPDPAQVSQWNLVDGGGNSSPRPSARSPSRSTASRSRTGVGFKRRPLYAPLTKYDLRIENSLYLQLAAPGRGRPG